MQWSDDRRIHGHCAVMKKVSRLGSDKSGVANAKLKSSLYGKSVCFCGFLVIDKFFDYIGFTK